MASDPAKPEFQRATSRIMSAPCQYRCARVNNGLFVAAPKEVDSDVPHPTSTPQAKNENIIPSARTEIHMPRPMLRSGFSVSSPSEATDSQPVYATIAKITAR